MKSKNSILKGHELARLIASCAATKKAERIALVRLTESAGVADWFVICQGDNAPHVRAIADAVIEGLKEKKIKAWHAEGLRESRWVLVDYSDIVVHVMLPDLREYYALEEWGPDSVEFFREEENSDE